MSTSASTTTTPQTQSNSHKMGDKNPFTSASTTTPPSSSMEDSLDTLRHKQTPASGHTHSRLTPHAFPFGNLPHSFAASSEARASVASLMGSRHSDPISEEWTGALLFIHDLIGTVSLTHAEGLTFRPLTSFHPPLTPLPPLPN